MAASTHKKGLLKSRCHEQHWTCPANSYSISFITNFDSGFGGIFGTLDSCLQGCIHFSIFMIVLDLNFCFLFVCHIFNQLLWIFRALLNLLTLHFGTFKDYQPQRAYFVLIGIILFGLFFFQRKCQFITELANWTCASPSTLKALSLVMTMPTAALSSSP